MSLKDTKIIIKEGGGSSSTLKKKKKEEEKKEKAVAVIKTDAPATSGKTLKEVLKENTGSTRTVAEPRQATPTAATNASTPSRSLKAVIAPDYSSPNADWRRPETFKAIPWEEYDKLGKTDRTAYLKAYAENSQREKQKRDEEAQAQAMQESIEASNKMVREKLYNTMIEGKYPMNLNNFHPDTVKYFEKRAYDDLSSGKISQSKYDFLPIHTYQGIDNKRQKLYNEGTNTTTQPHLQTSGFDRYRTERYDYVPANYVGNKKPSSGNASQSDEQSKNNLTTPFPISWEFAPISPYNYKNQQMYAISHQGKPMPEEMFATSKKNVNPIEENKRQAEIQKNVVEMMKVCLSSEENVSRLKEINDAYGYIEFGADVGEMTFEALYEYVRNGIKESQPPVNIGVGTWAKKVDADLKWLDETFEPFLKLTKDIGSSKLSNLDLLGLGADVGLGVLNNISSGADVSTTIADAFVDFSYAAGGMTAGAAAGSIFPGAGTAIGALIGGLVGIGIDYFYEKFTEETSFYGKSLKDHSKENWREIFDSILPF